MHVWDYDLRAIRKKRDFVRFQLERMINYGLNRKKIDKKLLKKYWKKIKIEPAKRDFLRLLLWGK